MRIALVSPYSWSFPGGVLRHVEALHRELVAAGHEARIFAPYDPDDALTRRLHRGNAPQPRPLPGHVTSLGRSVGLAMNGSQSNLALSPRAALTLRRELADGDFDVVHLHEPIAPAACWDAMTSAGVPIVATFHCYSDNAFTNNLGVLAGARRRMNRIGVRIAVSEAASWTGRRFFGGEYRVIPNGVDVPGSVPVEPAPAAPLRIVFVGQAQPRKGLPVLLRAFEALREHVPAELTIVGADRDEVEPLLMDGGAGITVRGRVGDEEKSAALREADVLCAPSLGGESFGMVLTEAFAAATPVVASAIAGYVDVVDDGVNGVLAPPGDATALAETLRSLALDAGRRRSLARGAAASAHRYAWPVVAREVICAYEDAIALPEPQTARQRAEIRLGLTGADLRPVVRAARVPPVEPPGARTGPAWPALARRVAATLLAALVVVGSVYAVQRIGPQSIVDALLNATPTLVLLALGLMCLSMAVRAVSWLAILRASFAGWSGRIPRYRDALRGTNIGVLMSATLPARLGEPARAFVVARRLGRPRSALPTVLGTIVSQTLLNVLALVILGAVMFASVDVFDRNHGALLAVVLVPVTAVLLIVAAPVLLGGRGRGRARDAAVRVGVALHRLRAGLLVFRDPRLGAAATVAQLAAWAVQWISCYVLLVAFGLDDRAGIGAAAAVLFAVNVSAILPATPSNLGVFQAACVFVLHKGYGISIQDALGYGIVLQAVEIATAFMMGAPALLGEGLSWRDVRLRALHATPVKLAPLHPGPARGVAAQRVEA